MSQSTDSTDDPLLDAILDNRPEVVQRLIGTDPAAFRSHHVEKLLDEFHQDVEPLLMVLLDEPHIHPVLKPHSARLFLRAIECKLTRAPKRLMGLFRYDQDPPTGAPWMDEAAWLELMSTCSTDPNVGMGLLEGRAVNNTTCSSSSRGDDPRTSLSARLTALWLEDPRLHPARFNMNAFWYACSSFKDEGMAYAILSDERIRLAIRTRSFLPDCILALKSTAILDECLSFWDKPIRLKEVSLCWTRYGTAVARRLLASAQFSPGPSERTPRRGGFAEWLGLLSNACLLVTADAWRTYRREHARPLMNPLTTAQPGGAHRLSAKGHAPLTTTIESSSRLPPAVPASYTPIQADWKHAASRVQPYVPSIRANHSLRTSSLCMVRPWIDAIESALTGQDSNLPTDWVHGLLVDYLLGPEHST